MWDLIVVGLGPAGSTAARLASQRGLKVLGLDKATFPRYKPCAAGLTGRAVQKIPFPMEKYADFSFYSAAIHMGDYSPIVVEDTECLMVTTHREILDTYLVEAAVNAGAEIRENQRVQAVILHSDHVTVKTQTGVESGRFIIGADGANSIVARLINSQRLPFLPAWEVEFEHGGSLSIDQLKNLLMFDLGIVRRGYGWAFPKKGTIAVGVAGRLRSRVEMDKGIAAMLRRLPDNMTLKVISEVGHPVPLFSSKHILGSSRVLLTGDAGGLIDPFLGEGIYHAILSGEIAVEWIHRNISEDVPKYSDYSEAINVLIGQELRVAARLAAIIYRFPDFMFRLTQRNKTVLADFGRCLTREGGYRTFAKTIGLPYKLIFLGMNS